MQKKEKSAPLYALSLIGSIALLIVAVAAIPRAIDSLSSWIYQHHTAQREE